ncbi:MAG: type II toxin-antitoxin system RelE/ParE family toxin [Betaproteobacteria bacterium]|nr:MAG: type II toxin-antitoxin system RelE/ParE family toxin [Betaproteobacteria bacterium]
MASVSYAQPALADLERLCDLLAESDPHAASQTIDLVFEAVAILERHPLVGHPAEADLRELVISRGKSGYIALYRYDDARDRVLVLAVRHQREAGYTG